MSESNDNKNKLNISYLQYIQNILIGKYNNAYSFFISSTRIEFVYVIIQMKEISLFV